VHFLTVHSVSEIIQIKGK